MQKVNIYILPFLIHNIFFFKFILEILNEDHYGIFEVKERIFEFLAISSFKGNIQVILFSFF